MMNEIMEGEATPAQIGGFLVALRLKGETADEIAGCAEAMREHVLTVRPKRDDLVDTAGTGGDAGAPINISTAAALVAAAAGAGVAKHGNRAVSSASGSADVLEALGFRLELPRGADRALDRRPRLRLPVRADVPPGDAACSARPPRARGPYGFNVLGPLTNPAGARAQVVGVYASSLVRTIAEVLAQLGAQARLRRPRRGRDRRALAGRARPRLRGRGGACASARSTRSSSASSVATRPTCAAVAR